MSILKIVSFEIEVSDFLILETSTILDLKFDSRKTLDSFNEFYRKNYPKLIEFTCAETKGSGYLGFFIYDSKCNARLYITNEPIKTLSQKSILNYNLVPLLRSYEKRLSIVINTLCKKGILSEEEASQLHYELNPLNTDLEHEIKDVQQYLVETKHTMQETREFFKSTETDSSL